MNQSETIAIRTALLIPHSANVRENVTPDLQDLAESIKEHGILQPLLVTRNDPKPGNPQEYTIIAGHRRAKAAMIAGLLTVPCVVREVQKDDEAVLMLVENTQRKDLNPIEQALALSALIMQGKSQKQVAKLLGRSEPWVSFRLGLLELSEQSQRRLVTGDMSLAQAEELVRASRRDKQDKGKAERGWLPPFLAPSHPLAKKVKQMCDARGHNGRLRVGKVGCGQCWETVIRADERIVVAVEQKQAAGEEVAPMSVRDKMMQATYGGTNRATDADGTGAGESSGDTAG